VAELERFDTPARLRDVPAAARQDWSATISGIFADYVGRHPQFYDPTAAETPTKTTVAKASWPAFPARLTRGNPPPEARWANADEDRAKQDEYCEWSVERDNAGKVTRLTFTTEVPEYWEFVAKHDRERLLDLYRELVAPDVERDELFDGDTYLPDNPRNQGTTGRLAHLVQGNNKLTAAVDLVARATVLRQRNGVPVTTQQALVVCSGLGDPFRHSDPQIAQLVNNAAAMGDEVTLRDPIGLYLDEFDATGFRAPDGTPAAAFWTIERGGPSHPVRARFEVPPGHGYAVGDLELDGRRITFGGQVADRVRVRVEALVKAADHRVVREPCRGG
jgi:hypothetical protein